MSKKVYALIVGVADGLIAIANTLVGFFQPPYTAAILGTLTIIAGVIPEICMLFVDPNKSTKKEKK